MAIDVHAHYVPRQLLDGVAARGSAFGVELLGPLDRPAIKFNNGFATRPLFPKLVEETAQRKESLDRQRLDHQIVATWPDMYGYALTNSDCIEWHRLLNDTLAEWSSSDSERFSFVASVPLTSPEASAAELIRAVEIGAVGVMLPSNVEGVNIGECDLDSFWACAERLNVPVIVHPVLVTPAPRIDKFALAQIAQYTFDTTLGVGSLIFNGVLDRFPNLSFVLSHGGGTFPYLVGRFDVMHNRMDPKATGNTAKFAPSSYASRFYYDSILHHTQALKFLADAVGASRIMLGTDEAFLPADLDPIASVEAAFTNASIVNQIIEENCRNLFTRLK